MLNNPKSAGAICLSILILLLFSQNSYSQASPKPMSVIAYYAGNGQDIKHFRTDQLTHIIYSFLHLKGNRLTIDNANDSLTILQLVELKKQNPGLKIILSLGGWGGCQTCSEVFNTQKGREEFAKSVLYLFKTFNTDGIDLDWEYPALESIPGHQFIPEDRDNFTLLLQTLRKTVGPKYELSFAAGGFSDFLQKSVDWQKVMPLVNYVNMMTYDLVNGNSKRTGHLTSLYSTKEQIESTDHAVRFLDSIGVPMHKVVIGFTFYARLFNQVEPDNNGLYQKGNFFGYLNFKDFDHKIDSVNGYTHYWDSIAKAPYAYNKTTKTFATYDNEQSIRFKMQYAKDKKLGGVMFWELRGDKKTNGLLEIINQNLK